MGICTQEYWKFAYICDKMDAGFFYWPACSACFYMKYETVLERQIGEMKNITVKDIVNATGGFLLCGDEDTPITGLCIDSRKAQAGDLFIPLLGNKVDGHRFIEPAMERASATLTSEHDNVVISEKPFIRVDDTMKALQAIGKDIRGRYDIPYIGVTGSVGKTTTREMIAAAVGTGRHCFQTNGNENSQIGVPMTLSRMTDGYDAAVIEMGISEPGQIKQILKR